MGEYREAMAVNEGKDWLGYTDMIPQSLQLMRTEMCMKMRIVAWKTI